MSDMIDPKSITLLASPPALDWPVTASITRVSVSADNTRIDFTKQDGADAWPPQPTGNPESKTDNFQYTIWLFLFISGKWFGAAFIQMWQGRDGAGDGIADYVKNWYFSGRGWTLMEGRAITPGEMIGYMVTAGDCRLGDHTTIHERSNIVTIPVPGDFTGDFTFAPDSPLPAPVPAQPAAPPSQPAPPGAPAPAPALDVQIAALLDELLAAGDRIVAGLSVMHDAIVGLTTRLDDVKSNGVKVHL